MISKGVDAAGTLHRLQFPNCCSNTLDDASGCVFLVESSSTLFEAIRIFKSKRYHSAFTGERFYKSSVSFYSP